MRLTNNYIRSVLALSQAALFCLIVASGTVFMHKHRTADGRIVIHTHPYNLTSDSDGSKHHHSDSEIHLLDVVFQGSYLQPDDVAVDFSLMPQATGRYKRQWQPPVMQECYALAHIRGPPACA